MATPAEQGSQRFYCHQCQIEMQPKQPDMLCPQCDGGFIEELPPRPVVRSFPHFHTHSHGHSHARHGHDTEGGVNVAPHPFANIFSQMAGGGQGHTHLAPDGTVTQRPPGMMLLNMSQNPTGGGRNFQLFVNGNRVQTGADGAEGGAAAAGAQGAGRPPAGIEGLLSMLLGGGGGLPGMHGNPGDYVWGAGGLDAIITQLLNNVDGSGPPPADKDKIEKLTSVKINQTQVDNNLECFVCFDDFELDEEVKVLPCKHHYHKDCIVPWLERHGTCPVCRKDLNGGDTTTTEFDRDIGETIGNIGTESEEGNNLDNSGSNDSVQPRPSTGRGPDNTDTNVPNSNNNNEHNRPNPGGYADDDIE